MKWVYNTHRKGHRAYTLFLSSPVFFGPPQPTKGSTLTVEELKAMDLIGVYYEIPVHVQPTIET